MVWSTILGDTCNRAATCNLQASARTATPGRGPIKRANPAIANWRSGRYVIELSTSGAPAKHSFLQSVLTQYMRGGRMRGRCTHRQIRIRLALTTQALRISPGAAERQVEVEVEAGVESGCKAQSSSSPEPPSLPPVLPVRGGHLGRHIPPNITDLLNPPHPSGFPLPITPRQLFCSCATPHGHKDRVYRRPRHHRSHGAVFSQL